MNAVNAKEKNKKVDGPSHNTRLESDKNRQNHEAEKSQSHRSAPGTTVSSSVRTSARRRSSLEAIFGDDNVVELARSTADFPANMTFDSLEHHTDFDTLLGDLADILESTEQAATQVFDPRLAEVNTLPDPLTLTDVQVNDFCMPDFLLGTDGDGNAASYSLEDFSMPNSATIGFDNSFNIPPSDLIAQSSPRESGRAPFNLYRPPAISDDSPDCIALLYNQRTCEVLCIMEDPVGNPWRRVVWPLAQEYPALYHAVAAMTCFNGAHTRPQLRAQGVQHLQNSMLKLSTDDIGSMRLEVALIATLALSIAQTWYYPRASNGISHINKAKNLLQQAISKNLASAPLEGNLHLGFLANTWLYMDVLTRITCNNVPAMDLNLMTACSTLSPSLSAALNIDPLMGCAGSLFPLIGRVADLVRRVRKSQNKTNPPSVVSRAVEIMTAIERWTPSLGLVKSSNPESLTSNTSDIVQTANSHKWATLLLLSQAVPELPIRFSFLEMARKVLVFIATIPLNSRASIFQILPLMIAGCEVTDDEDRDWVREKWESMIGGNSSGIVERCLELTLEVWRRRDRLAKRCKACRSSEERLANDTCSILDPLPDSQESCSCGRQGQESVQSRQGEVESRTYDTLYTVRSRLHWLSVMEEWGWEGKLFCVVGVSITNMLQ